MENNRVYNNVQVVLAICFVLIPETLHGLPEVTDSFSVNDAYDVMSDNDYDYDYYGEYLSENEMLQFDPLSHFRPGSQFCTQKSTCSELSFSWPSKNCYCDDLCQAFEDCCPNYIPSDVISFPKVDLFECIVLPEIEKRFGVFIITKCPSEWPDKEIRSLCETNSNQTDMLLKLPVSENDTEILYKNMYCAYCNERYDFKFWSPEFMCEAASSEMELYSMTTLPNCDLKFIPPSRESALQYRKCPTKNFVRDCPHNLTDEILKNKCEKGNTSHVFASEKSYKNIACAKCHQVPLDLIYCEPDPGVLFVTPDIGRKKSYSFRVLVDFNTEEGEIGRIMEETDLDFSQKCSNDEIYDPFSEKCRKIFCVLPRVPFKGKCIIKEGAIITKDSSVLRDASVDAAFSENCTLMKLLPSEFDRRNNSQVYVYSSEKLYDESEYYQLGSEIYICHEDLQDCSSECKQNIALPSDIVESYITRILLVISLAALSFNFFIYICFPQLRNTPGKILMCLIISLFFAQLFFLISPQFEEHRTLCIVSATIVHFFFMAAFCWMNVIALDLWMTFSNQFITAGSNEKSRRFLFFSLYAWLVPVIIVGFSIIIDNIDTSAELESFKPSYGNGACWMTSRNGVLLLFVGPLAVFKLFDIIAFINTAIHIYKAKKHGAAARRNSDSCTFWLNLKLSLVMGLTWVFAFVANFANESVIWYLFIIFNALQGVFIAVTFIFTRKVIRLLSEKAQQLSSFSTKSTKYEISISDNMKKSSTSSGTKLTNVPQSDETV